jgi:plastocyanin
MDETLFYVFGIALVLSALALSALGLRSESFPPSRIVLAGVVAYFVVLVGATTTFAVLNARDDQRKRDAEKAEAAATVPAGGEKTTTTTGPTTTTGSTTTTPAAQGGGETVKVSSPADGSLVYEPNKLTAKAGSVTIEYDNPSPVDHSIAIEGGGKTLDASEIAANTTLTASADLQPGRFVYYCTVPGHREAGMVGTLTVK